MRDPAFRQETVRAHVEERRAVCRGEAESLPGARQVPRPVQSANSGLPQRDRPEPEAPRRANLLLARGLLVTQANKISLIAEVDEFRDRLFQQAPYVKALPNIFLTTPCLKAFNQRMESHGMKKSAASKQHPDGADG